MTATVEPTVTTPCGGTPAPAAPAGRSLNTGELNATPGVAAVTTPAAVSLDLALGERDATRCSVCSRPMPALEHPKFELEDADTGLPLCDVDANRQHKGLRLAMALMNAVLDAYRTGDKQAAEDTIRGVVSGIELLEETAPTVRYQRPARHQPRRNPRSRRR